MKEVAMLLCCVLSAASLRGARQEQVQNTQDIKVFRDYHKNGHIRKISHQGTFSGCGVPVGIDSIFSERGTLLKIIAYDHRLGEGRGCHDVVTWQTITTFYANGRCRSIAYMEACYECEPVAVGRWQWYDSLGKLIGSKKQTK